MPLPDERPRQSVANLIGRFETQTKHLSSASSPPRSSSVVSHVTGDSHREETKEKREWPPKSFNVPVEKPPLVLSSLSSRNIPTALITSYISSTTELGTTNKWKQETAISSTDEADVPLTAKALNASQRKVQAEPNLFLENWRKDLPVSQAEMEADTAPTVAAPPLIPQVGESIETPTPSSVHKVATPSTPRTSNVPPKTTTARTPASASSKGLSSATRTPAKTPLKPKQSLTPVTQPLRPQHTGQSVVSTTTAARKPALPKAPVTAAKTPSRPDASPAKTPTSRPKTPSTGLFAPTAASLARSRNALPPLPTPTKKATLSTSAMDRLSKPTAASQARMAAAAPAIPARGTAATSRTTAMKPKATTTSPKKPTKKESVLAPVVTAGVVASAATAEALGQDSDVGDKSEIVDPAESETPEAADEAQSAQRHEELFAAPVEEETGSTGSGDNEATPTSSVPAFESTELEITEAPAVDEKVPTAAHDTKDDLEDIINLLESVSIAKSSSDIINIPDEILEIPDEDDK